MHAVAHALRKSPTETGQPQLIGQVPINAVIVHVDFHLPITRSYVTVRQQAPDKHLTVSGQAPFHWVGLIISFGVAWLSAALFAFGPIVRIETYLRPTMNAW
jgi:hypothetical protein